LEWNEATECFDDEEKLMELRELGVVVVSAMNGKEVWPTFPGSLDQRRLTSK